MGVRAIFAAFLAIFLAACADHAKTNASFESILTNHQCDEAFLTQNEDKIAQNDDVIYTGINSGLVARNCAKYEASNRFFDSAEEAYKYDVDLQNVGKTAGKLVASTLTNETIMDYEGSLYERIMVNLYKALNYMSLNDPANARIEFNRALMRQDKAKEYFAKEIENNKKELEDAKKDQNYDKNMGDNTKTIEQEYSHLFKEFDTAKNFTNPYATYLASIFFYMDKDYRKAADLFKEVAATYPKNKEIAAQNKIFKERATKTKIKNPKTYAFIVYESGLGAIKDDFTLKLPFVVPAGKDNKLKVISASVALQTLKKRDNSLASIKADGLSTSPFLDLDNIVATEFKIKMPSMIAKALAQTIVKTTLNLVVAKHDATGGWLSLATAVVNTLTTKADVRSWQGLPKTINIVMVPNSGAIKLNDGKGDFYTADIDKSRDALIIVRSFTPHLPMSVDVIQLNKSR